MAYSTGKSSGVKQNYPPSWEPFKNGVLPAGAVLGGHTRSAGPCYIARTKDTNDQWVPAIFVPRSMTCISIARDKKFFATANFQILCHCKTIWVEVVVNKQLLPMKSLPVYQNNKNGNEKSYFGRMMFDDHVMLGEVSMEDECCYIYKRKTEQWEPLHSYEVLTVSQNELDELKKQDNPSYITKIFGQYSTSNPKPAPSPTLYHDTTKGAEGNEDYTWKKAENGMVPAGAYIACRSNTLGDIYVGRSSHRGEVLPGKFIPKLRCCIVGYEGKEVKKNNYEVLCNAKVQWIPMTQRNIPENAVLGGKTQSEPLYIGRVPEKNSVGKVQQGICLVVYGNTEHMHKNYEILVTSSTSMKSKGYKSSDSPKSLLKNRKHTDDQNNLMKITRGQPTAATRRAPDSDEEYATIQTQQTRMNKISTDQPNLIETHKPHPMGAATSDMPYEQTPKHMNNERKAMNYSLTEPKNQSGMQWRHTEDQKNSLKIEQETRATHTSGVKTSGSEVQYIFTTQAAQFTNEIIAGGYNRTEPQDAFLDRAKYSDQSNQMEKRQHDIYTKRDITPTYAGSLIDHQSNATAKSSFTSHDGDWERVLPGANIRQKPLPAGHDFDGNPIYIARARHGLCLLVGGLLNLGHPLQTYYNNEIYENHEYQVFCNPNVLWQKMREGDKIPNNAVHCGYNDEEQNIFVGRVAFGKSAQLIAPVYETSPQCLLIIDDQEVPFNTFEIMVTGSENGEPTQVSPIRIHSAERMFQQLEISQNNSNHGLNSSGGEATSNLMTNVPRTFKNQGQQHAQL